LPACAVDPAISCGSPPADDRTGARLARHPAPWRQGGPANACRLAARSGPQVQDCNGMEKRQINPWTWQDELGFSQAWRLDGAQTLILLAGQSSVAADGTLVGEGDFEAQARQTFANLRTVLAHCGAQLESIYKLVVYLTNIANLPTYERIVAEVLPGPKPVGTALEVSALATPGMMIEIDATAVL
jgi:enamine deaminase RidA (YjgF/YER057c/UK114 family)